MNRRPPRAQQWLPPRSEPSDRRLPTTSEASVSHGKPYAAVPAPGARPPHVTLRRSLLPRPQKNRSHHLLPIKFTPFPSFCPQFFTQLLQNNK